MSKSSFFFPTIENSIEAYNHLRDHISYEQEEIWVICLNNLKKPLSTKKIFIGSVDQSLIHPREILREVILSKSSSYILCHSHPSGDPHPSKEDIEITNVFLKISTILRIPLDDHIIYAKDSYFSFLDSNLL